MILAALLGAGVGLGVCLFRSLACLFGPKRQHGQLLVGLAQYTQRFTVRRRLRLAGQ